MAVRTRRLAAAQYLPLTVQDCKDHMRITFADAAQDALIAIYLQAAVTELEALLQRTLCETSWVATYDAFSDALKLPMPPVLSVTSVKYLDTTGTQQTLNANQYAADTVSEPGYIVLAPTATAWPTTQAGAINAVQVTYKCGYVAAPANQAAAAAAIPGPLRAWLLLRIATMFENREAVAFGQPYEVPTLACLTDPYKVLEV